MTVNNRPSTSVLFRSHTFRREGNLTLAICMFSFLSGSHNKQAADKTPPKHEAEHSNPQPAATGFSFMASSGSTSEPVSDPEPPSNTSGFGFLSASVSTTAFDNEEPVQEEEPPSTFSFLQVVVNQFKSEFCY